MNRAIRGTGATATPRCAGAPPLLRLSRSVYRALLWSMPRQFRRDRGAEVVMLFEDMYREAWSRRGATGLLRLWLQCLGRLAASAAGARVEQVRRPASAGAGGGGLGGWGRDLRHGLRVLVRQPGYAAVVVLTLGLAIGVNSTVFSMVKTVAVPRMPFADPDRLVFAYARNPDMNRVRDGLSYPDFVDLRRRSDAISDLAAWTASTATLTGGNEPARVRSFRISGSYLDVVGVAPAAGRGIGVADEAPGGSVVMLSDGAWRRRFGADPGVLGRQVRVDGREHTVVGIMPAALEFGTLRAVELWLPLQRDAASAPRDQRDLVVVGRLQAGASLAAFEAEVAALAGDLRRSHPTTHAEWELYALSFRQATVGVNALGSLALMSVAVAFVLAIACVNVGNLTMARASARRRELALRLALGASRGHLIRQLLVESALLSLAAAGAGLLLARWTFAALVAVTRGQLGLFAELAIDPQVLAFTLLLAIVTPLAFGLLPALRGSSGQLAATLQEGGRGGTGGRRRTRLRAVLTAGQVGLAVMLLVVAGLAVRSVAALFAIPLGFQSEGVLTFRVELPERSYPDASSRHEFFDAARAAVAAVPGVVDAGWVSQRPILGRAPNRPFLIVGRSDEATPPSAGRVLADPSFRAVAGLPLLRGRWLAEADRADAPSVAVISRAALERYWPGRDPIGERLRFPGSADSFAVVGVVGDIRNSDADQPPEPQIYLPLAQADAGAMALMATTRGAPEGAADDVRRAVWGVDSALPIDDLRTMSQIVRDDLASDVAVIGLMSFFALAALALASVGVYSVISYSVGQRGQEIGVRMAVGARRGAVVQMVVRQGLAPVFAGLVGGLVGGLGVARVIASRLYGVGPTDPTIFIGVPLLLTAIGLLACALPAGRAAAIDPVRALRVD